MAGMSQLLQGQKYWDNNKKISEELFQAYFGMSVSVAQNLLKFNDLETEVAEMKEQNLAKLSD